MWSVRPALRGTARSPDSESWAPCRLPAPRWAGSCAELRGRALRAPPTPPPGGAPVLFSIASGSRPHPHPAPSLRPLLSPSPTPTEVPPEPRCPYGAVSWSAPHPLWSSSALVTQRWTPSPACPARTEIQDTPDSTASGSKAGWPCGRDTQAGAGEVPDSRVTAK